MLQLAAHDFFNVNRELEIDFENVKLDLGTLLDHGDENIPFGGEFRNISIFIPLGVVMTIDLLELDSSFAE